jgi:hypothetical protein
MRSLSKPGIGLAAAYVILCAVLIGTQGLFGESFIAIILGMPWTLALSSIEFGNASGALLYVLILAPMILNALILYWIGSLFGKRHA